jgi:hypothetical protein
MSTMPFNGFGVCHDAKLPPQLLVLLLLVHPHCICLLYKVELGNSIQKHILRLYVTKYSNLGTMNASSISWSTGASKLEHGARPHCNLFNALACCNLATHSMPLLRQNQVLGWIQPPPIAAAYLVNVSPWLCFYLSTVCPFFLHAVALLPGMSFATLN